MRLDKQGEARVLVPGVLKPVRQRVRYEVVLTIYIQRNPIVITVHEVRVDLLEAECQV